MDVSKLPPQVQIGYLTDYQRKLAADWLITKWGRGDRNGLPICQSCKDPNMSWSMGDHVLAPVVVANTGMNLGGVAYPVYSVMCSNCGEVHYLNALVMGLMKLTDTGSLMVATDPALEQKPAQNLGEVKNG
jgi:hypothetical protein